MNRPIRNKRVVLNDINCQKILKAINKLSAKSCKLSSSDFVNFCTELFIDKYLDKEIAQFEKKFFDRKKYLKMMMQEDNLDAFKSSLKQLNSKLQASKKCTDRHAGTGRPPS